MTVQQTLGIIKPDATERKLSWTIICMARNFGLNLVALDSRTLTREVAEALYAEHSSKDWFPLQIDYMTSGPVDCVVFHGEDAVRKWRALMGPTDITKATPGTIRHAFALDFRRNSVHGSDSLESATREIQLIFGRSWTNDLNWQSMALPYREDV